MKVVASFLLSIGLILSSGLVSAHFEQSATSTVRLSEPVTQDANSETFGVMLDSSLSKVSLTSLATSGDKHLGKPFLLETKIAKVCQKKGCFFIAQEQEHVIRVSFKDYGFFIPSDAGGKTVTLVGELIQKELSANQAEHFKQDLKTDTDVVKAGVVYEIVANSIKIPRSS
jgi:hypothetical protein